MWIFQVFWSIYETCLCISKFYTYVFILSYMSTEYSVHTGYDIHMLFHFLRELNPHNY